MVRQGIQQTPDKLRGEAIKWQWRFVKQNILANLVDADVDQRHEFFLVVLRLLLLLGRAASVFVRMSGENKEPNVCEDTCV